MSIAVDERGVEQPQELLDLPVLGLAAGLEPALGVGQPEHPEQRVVGGEQPLLVAVVVALDLDRLLARRCARRPRFGLVTRSWSVCGRRLDVPVAERLVEQRVHGVAGRRRPTGWFWVCACVSSYVVTWRCRPALRST